MVVFVTTAPTPARQTEAAGQKEAEATPAKLEKVQARYAKRLGTAQRRVAQAEARLEKARHALGKIQAQADIAAKKRTWNLGTSLKSYIDPRVYYDWGQQVDYDVLERYYPKALRQKFAWVKDKELNPPDNDFAQIQASTPVVPTEAAE